MFRNSGVPEASIGGVIFLVFWALSLLIGIPGFALLVALPMLIARLTLPGTFSGSFGWLMLAYIVFPWIYLRWRLIANPVRTHRLPRSTCPACTWTWAFACVPVLFRLRQSRFGKASDPAWSFSSDSGLNVGLDSSGGAGASGGGGAESSGGGGESGGGGASDSW
jgi:uncharacterized membrane protein YgcG